MVKIKGGDKLRAKLDSIARNLKKAAVLEIGFFDASYPNGTSVATVAAIQNFGAPSKGIPPRPFLSNTVARYERQWPKQLASFLKATDFDSEKALNMLGPIIQDEVKVEIYVLDSPPLSPVTLMVRKLLQDDPTRVRSLRLVNNARWLVSLGASFSGVSTKPLIDSGLLVNSVEYKVKSGEVE